MFHFRLVLLLQLLFTTYSAVNGPELVNTTNGRVQGYINGANVRIWSGIRYAQAPINSLRFADPLPPTSSISSPIYNAVNVFPGCPQDCLLPAGPPCII